MLFAAREGCMDCVKALVEKRRESSICRTPRA